jgi:single-stranded-DNA-specific exonuclease
VWGQGFPLPSFDDVFKVKSSKLVGKKSEHVQLVLERGGRTFQGIKFRYEGGAVPEWVRLIYKLDANTFNNNTRLQLMVEHLLPA